MNTPYYLGRFEIRKLGKRDLPQITDHLLRLDQDTRRLRFGSAISDTGIRSYAAHMLDEGSLVVGAFPDGALRAIGELQGLCETGSKDAEIALSVEPEWQGQGIGSALFSRLVDGAQNRGIDTLHVLFMNQNERMRRIAEKHEPGLRFHGGQIEATFDAPRPTPLSVYRENVQDILAFARHWLMQGFGGHRRANS